MIFVTVGTHEQSFDRLIKEVDNLKKEGFLSDEVFIQRGYSKYFPKYCESIDFLGFDEMESYLSKSDIVICHGGVSTYMNALLKRKKTIIFPRLKEFDEHVNNHQLEFLENISKFYNLVFTTNEKDILQYIKNFDNQGIFLSRNSVFCKDLERIICEECLL